MYVSPLRGFARWAPSRQVIGFGKYFVQVVALSRGNFLLALDEQREYSQILFVTFGLLDGH